MSIDFVAFDVETANWNRGSICAVGWAVVRDGQIVENGSQLCRPPEDLNWFVARNTAIHRITADAVSGEPSFAQVAPALIDRFAGLPVVAHNAAFDLGALRDAHDHSGIPWPSLSYGCTLIWSRRLLDLPSHRLPVVCEHLGFPLDRHHDAGCDARAAANIALALAGKIEANCIDDLATATNGRLGHMEPGQWAGCQSHSTGSAQRTYSTGSVRQIPEANLDADPDNPFFGQRVLFTGALECMSRDLAEDCVARAGGHIEKGVTKKTSILVLGDNFRGDTFTDFRNTFLTTSKARKAVGYRDLGQPIEFWSEVDFVQALMTTDVSPFRER